MSDEPPAKRGKRIKPCQRCKTQRRKCERDSSEESCTRCIKSNRECINVDGTLENNDDTIDGMPELQYLTEQVVDLQQSLEQVELYIQNNQLKTAADIDDITDLLNQMTNKEVIDNSNNDAIINNHNSNLDYTVSIFSSPNSQDYYLTDGENELTFPSPSLSSYTAFSSIPSSNLTILSVEDEENNNDNKNNNSNYNWELTLVNGELRLDKPIKSIEELIAYGNAFSRYLSPFSGAFNNTSFLFENNQPESLICVAIDAVSLTDLRRFKKNNTYKMIADSSTPLKSYDRLFNQNGFPHIHIVEEMVALYFTCLNPGLPMIHAPSYWNNYDRDVRPNPFKHGITMGLCSIVCSSSCKHNKYVAHEKRLLCEFFFEQALDMLYDIFDDPDKKLESIIMINLLSNYYRYTLRISEARKWCSISYLLCKDLKNEYDIPMITTLKKNSPTVSSPTMSTTESVSSSSSTSSTSTTTTTTSSSYYNISLTSNTENINRALFSRHYAISVAQEKFIKFIIDHDHTTDEYLTSIPMFHIEDEGDIAANFLEIYNHLLTLMTNPVILEWAVQSHKMLIGEPAEFSLELILKFDQAYNDWWKSVPSHFRICDEDPSNTICRKYIGDCYDEYKLLLFSIVLAHRAESYISLARPSNQSTVCNDGSYALLRAIQDRALNTSFECCVTMVMAIRKLQLVKDYCLFTSDFLITIADLLSSLVESFDEAIAQKSKEKLKQTLFELKHGFFMEGSIVPSTSSPLNHFKILKKTAPKNASLNLFDMYYNYASPILAFSYDILRNSIKEDV